MVQPIIIPRRQQPNIMAQIMPMVQLMMQRRAQQENRDFQKELLEENRLFQMQMNPEYRQVTMPKSWPEGEPVTGVVTVGGKQFAPVKREFYQPEQLQGTRKWIYGDKTTGTGQMIDMPIKYGDEPYIKAVEANGNLFGYQIAPKDDKGKPIMEKAQFVQHKPEEYKAKDRFEYLSNQEFLKERGEFWKAAYKKWGQEGGATQGLTKAQLVDDVIKYFGNLRNDVTKEYMIATAKGLIINPLKMEEHNKAVGDLRARELKNVQQAIRGELPEIFQTPSPEQTQQSFIDDYVDQKINQYMEYLR